MISPKDKSQINTGFIIEFKTCKDGDFAKSQIEAFAQIDKQQYAAKLISQGIKNICKIAVSFYGQAAKVEMA